MEKAVRCAIIVHSVCVCVRARFLYARKPMLKVGKIQIGNTQSSPMFWFHAMGIGCRTIKSKVEFYFYFYSTTTTITATTTMATAAVLMAIAVAVFHIRIFCPFFLVLTLIRSNEYEKWGVKAQQ